MLLLIFANCIAMAAKDPLTIDDGWSAALEWIFTGLFTAEMMIKMAAMGISPLESRRCYFSEGWNCLDGFIVLISWASQLSTRGSLSSLRTFRVLRPLRSISRLPGVRLLVVAIFKSLPALRDVLLLFSFFLLGYAIVGVELFRGRLHYRCYDASLASAPPSAIAAAEPGDVCTCRNLSSAVALEHGGGGCTDYCGAGEVCLYTPLNPNGGASSFDHVFDATVAIFQSVSLEGWSDLMHMLSVSQPQLAPLYFVVLVVFGSFFVLNLYAVVMSDAYLATQDKLAVEAAKRALAKRDAKKISRRERANKFKAEAGKRLPLRQRLGEAVWRVYGHLAERVGGAAAVAVEVTARTLPGIPSLRRVVGNSRFETVMVVLILANTFSMAMEFHGAASTPAYESSLQACNVVFSFIFLVEMLLRIGAFGPVAYGADAMNLFDAAVVLVSFVELGITAAAASVPGVNGLNVSGLRTLRLFRAVRALKAFKLARSFKGLRTLLRTMVVSVGQTRDLAFLLVLALFIFALLGIELFAGVLGSCASPVSGSLGTGRPRDLCLASGQAWTADKESYDTFGSAFMTVLVVFIGENWNSVWHAAFPYAGWLSTAYFVVALVVGNLMILNLFLGIIVGSFCRPTTRPTARWSSRRGSSRSPSGCSTFIAATPPPTSRPLSRGYARRSPPSRRRAERAAAGRRTVVQAARGG